MAQSDPLSTSLSLFIARNTCTVIIIRSENRNCNLQDGINICSFARLLVKRISNHCISYCITVMICKQSISHQHLRQILHSSTLQIIAFNPPNGAMCLQITNGSIIFKFFLFLHLCKCFSIVMHM